MENKVAVMRKLEARVMMVNRLKRKSLKKNVRGTKWKDMQRMSTKRFLHAETPRPSEAFILAMEQGKSVTVGKEL